MLLLLAESFWKSQMMLRQSLEVPNLAIHNEGAVGTVPTKLIAVYVVEKGKPLVNPIK